MRTDPMPTRWSTLSRRKGLLLVWIALLIGCGPVLLHRSVEPVVLHWSASWLALVCVYMAVLVAGAWAVWLSPDRAAGRVHAALSALWLMSCGALLAWSVAEAFARTAGVNRIPFVLQFKYDIGAARAFKRKWRRLHREHPRLGYAPRPGVRNLEFQHPDFTYRVSTISLPGADIGVRDDGFEGEADLVLVGDSFAHGEGVELSQTLSERLESMTGRDCINMGVQGYCTLQEDVMLRDVALPLKPKAVIWLFFPNDVVECVEFSEGSAWTTHLREATSIWHRLEPGYWLRHSVVIGLARHSLGRDVEGTPPAVQVRTEDVDLVLTFSENLDLNERGWDLASSALKRSVAATKESGASFLLVFAPPKEATYESVIHIRHEYVQRWRRSIADMRARLQALAVEADCDYLDLTPAFQRHCGEQLYFRADGHWNAAGHALAARELVAHGLADSERSAQSAGGK